MIELNLLPDVKQEFVRTQRMKRVIISIMILASIAAGAVVALLVFYVYIAQPIRQKLADDDIANTSKKLTDNKNLTRDLTIQNQLKAITQLHEEKIVITRLFSFFTVLNPEKPNNIKISKAMTDTAAGTITVDASGVSYNAVSVFQDTLKNAKLSYFDPDTKEQTQVPLFTNIEVSEVGLGKDSDGNTVVSFRETLTYEIKALAWTLKNPVVIVPNKKTTPSAERVSDAIFSDGPAAKKEGEQ